MALNCQAFRPLPKVRDADNDQVIRREEEGYKVHNIMAGTDIILVQNTAHNTVFGAQTDLIIMREASRHAG